MVLKNRILSALCAVFASLTAFAQEPGEMHYVEVPADTLEARIYYPVNKYMLREDYMGNAATLARLDSALQMYGLPDIDTLHITGISSPEGRKAYNMSLSEHRSATLLNYLEKHYPGLAGKLRPSPVAENWVELRHYVEKDTYLPADKRQEILDLLDDPSIDDEVRETRLKARPEYRELFDRYFSYLRFAKVRFVYKHPAIPEPDIDFPIEVEDCTPEFAELDTYMEPIALLEYLVERPIVAVSTNLLYDLAIPVTTPNFAYEIPIGKHWSFWSEYTFPWWLAKANDRAWEILKWDVAGRYWLKPRSTGDRVGDVLTGHFFGLDLSAGYYDIEPKHTGYQGEFQSVGLEYGYAWRLNRHWRLDASVAAGWMGTHYRYYEGSLDDQHLLYQYNGKFNWFGPTRANISIKYIFSHKSRRSSK